MECLRRFFERMVNWIRGLFKRLPEPELEVKPTTTKPILWMERMKAKWPSFRFVNTTRDLPSAPRHQPCPSCHGWRRRVNKTLGLATYRCGKCDLLYNVKLGGGLSYGQKSL